MAGPKKIWVLPEIDATVEESSKVALGLLSEARDIADKVDGSVTALVFTPESRDYSEVLNQYGIDESYLFTLTLFEYPSAEAYAAAPPCRSDRSATHFISRSPYDAPAIHVSLCRTVTHDAECSPLSALDSGLGVPRACLGVPVVA